MVAHKVGRYSMDKILSQFPVNERGKIKQGIEATIELEFFVLDGGDVCLTDKGEKLFEVLSNVSKASNVERLEMKKLYPKTASLLDSINHDSRLTPPAEVRSSSG